MHTPKHSSHGPFNMSLFSWVQKMKKSLPLNIRLADFKPISLSLSQSQMVWLIYLFTFIFSFITLSYADDAAVMGKLLASFDTTPSGWSATTDCCKSKNVNCDGSNRVTSINLASQSPTGTLPSNLSTLTQLTTLSPRQLSLWTSPHPRQLHFSSKTLP